MKVSYRTYRLMRDGSKTELIQMIGDGSIIDRFDRATNPQSPDDIVCPGFLNLKWATGCPYDCAWCYLNGTLRLLPYRKKPHLKDRHKIKRHVAQLLTSPAPHPELLNAGELCDSLMTENTDEPFSRFIAECLQGQDRYKVLFVTKGGTIDHLLAIRATKHIVVSFSLNIQAVINRWEKGTPGLEDRFEAALKLQKAGYEVRVRVDPIIPGQIADYLNLCYVVARSLVPSRITLGSLRGLGSTITNCTDKSWVALLEEPSRWGRRVAHQIRQDTYASLIGYLRQRGYGSPIALCKEPVKMWESLEMDYRRVKCNCVW